MKIEQIIVYKISLPLKEPFSSSLGTFQERSPVLIEIVSEGLSAWGEASALPLPFYNHEDTTSVLHILKNYLCPLIIKEQPQDADSLNKILNRIVGNNIAKSGVESAFWDLIAKRDQRPLYQYLGGVRTEIESGVVVPDFNDIGKTHERISQHIAAGYKRIKLKVTAGRELSLLQAVSSKFQTPILALDANGAYSLSDIDLFKEIDALGLAMVEQPFKKGELLEHAKLQAAINTPVCLDESVENLNEAKLALALGSCKVINLKPSRVGGLYNTQAIHDCCTAANIAVCCGGMLETGIGRAHSMATATLPSYTYPADLSESQRYFERDIIEPEISFIRPGVLRVSDKPGIGVNVRRSEIEHRCTEKYIF